jgi:hypothetical protein
VVQWAWGENQETIRPSRTHRKKPAQGRKPKVRSFSASPDEINVRKFDRPGRGRSGPGVYAPANSDNQDSAREDHIDPTANEAQQTPADSETRVDFSVSPRRGLDPELFKDAKRVKSELPENPWNAMVGKKW